MTQAASAIQHRHCVWRRALSALYAFASSPSLASASPVSR